MARRRPAEPVANPARGALLVIAAVVLGLFLLRNGIDTSLEVTSDGAAPRPTANDQEPDDDDEADDTTTTTTVAARAPSEVRVIVLNAGSGVTGAAGRWSSGLEAYGYQMLPAGNAITRVEVSQVLHREGFEAEAGQVLDAMGSPEGVGVASLGAEAPGEIGDASVIVLLGPDIAAGDPPAPGAGDEPATEGDGADDGESADDG